MISRDQIDRIMDAALIEEVVGEFVPLKRSGSSYRGLSPFTSERTPSFFVIPSKGIFKDFSSGKGGSVVTFLMEHEKMSYPEALRWLAKRYNIEIEEEKPSEEESLERSERESLLAVTEWAAKYFEQCLWETEEGQNVGHSYFIERGFRDDTIRKFRLGYCLSGWDHMTQAALAAGFELKWLIAAGLTRESGEKHFDFFRERVIFPVLDVSGRVIAFGGRILRSDKKTAKYFNSPESALYIKSKVVYGIYHARQAMAREDRCFLVEGYTDVTSLHQAGVENVVASSGTALTDDQVRLIKRYTENITILYDGDPAGIRASFRGINLILSQGLNVRVVLFPDGDDPDSFARRVSTDELMRYITEEARDFLSFKTDMLAQDAAGDPIKRAGMIRDVVESIVCIPDAIKRSVYIQECSHLLHVDEQVLLAEVNKLLRKKTTALPERDAPPPVDEYTYAVPDELPHEEKHAPSLKNIIYIESELARLLVRYGRYPVVVRIDGEDPRHPEEQTISAAEFILSELQHEQLDVHFDLLRLVSDVYLEHLRAGEFPEEKRFLNHENVALVSFYCDQTADRYHLSQNWSQKHRIFPETEEMNIEQGVKWCIHKLKLFHVRFMMSAVETELKDCSAEEQEYVLLAEQMRLNRIKIEISRYFGSAIL